MKNTSKIVKTVIGILLAAAGICCIAIPGMNLRVIGWVAGICMLVYGFTGMIVWARKKETDAVKYEKHINEWRLAESGLSVVLGIVTVFYCAFAAVENLLVVYVISAWIIINGFVRIAQAMTLYYAGRNKEAETDKKRLTVCAVTSAVMVLFASFAIMNPSFLLIGLALSASIDIIISGADLITVAWAE